MSTSEHRRLADAADPGDDLLNASLWYEWGPYLSERAWGTVREDYSADGDAWNAFSHDDARSRAYRWNEDGMAGLSDIGHDLCLALALWNGRDPILKERMFGLTGPQGNHGEDVKDYWWYLDALPSHAWLRWRYHYPQGAFPYEDLVAENGRRGFGDPEYELLDTGAFDEDRYWVVDVTYAKADPTDVLARITIENKGPDPETLHVLPTLWFRNTWSWDPEHAERPSITLAGDGLEARHERLGSYRLEAMAGPDGTPPKALFCENVTNTARLFGAAPLTPYPKDGINDHVVAGAATVNPDEQGTKAAWWYQVTVPAGGTAELRLRLRSAPAAGAAKRPKRAAKADPTRWTDAFDLVLREREAEAEEFYAALAPPDITPERALILRQACAGLVWSKQMYCYGVERWLAGDPGEPPPPAGRDRIRNGRWRHLDAFDVLAMPDPWEYPWFAAWDLAFHAMVWAHLDPAFAKYQVTVLLREWFQHPNGAVPAYEWSFDDLNPPVHALAALRVFNVDGGRDVAFLERVFQKLLVNFTWWLNRLDPDDDDLFGGGFLGFDNISPIDRSHLPAGTRMEQADGTAWTALYALAMLLMAAELAEHDEVYDDMVVKFLEHFASISRALNRSGMWDPDEAYFFDRLLLPDGEAVSIRVQTIAGAIPLLAGTRIDAKHDERTRRLGRRFRRMEEAQGEDESALPGQVRRLPDTNRLLVSLVAPDALRTALGTLFDPQAFLSPHGLRSVSKRYEGRPYEVPSVPGARIDYQPAESRDGMYGGNSNWRGPVWFPANYLVIMSLLSYDRYMGSAFTLEYPTGSGQQRTLAEIAGDLADRLVSIWLPDADGRRPVYGGTERFQTDPAWKDNLLFFEYFHGDDGAGLGASHQTGWTALVADLIIRPPAAGLARNDPARPAKPKAAPKKPARRKSGA
ncbi:MAG TPA: hypothetical protein VII98_02600 [Solirubrobacteraceae bacterium]